MLCCRKNQPFSKKILKMADFFVEILKKNRIFATNKAQLWRIVA